MTGISLLKRYARIAEYDYVVKRDVMVTMRDGVRLATDIYLPAQNGEPVEGKFPTLLERTPYNKGQPLQTPGATVWRSITLEEPKFFVERGYAFVRQDVRGRFVSEGEFYPYVNEGSDGYDTVEWIAGQSWSNGLVGTRGHSYQAAVQDALAREKPPHLKAMFVGEGTTNYHMDSQGTGGAFRLAHDLMYSLSLAINVEKSVRENSALRAWLTECEKNAGDWLKKPLSGQISIFEGVATAKKWYSDWIEHQDYDDYWKQNGYCSEGFYGQYPDIPIYRYTGHYAQFSRSGIVSYIELAKIHESPTFLQYGPWYDLCQEYGDVEFGPEYPSNDRRERVRDEQLRFFDQFLMGLDTDILDEPKVKVFVMGGGNGSKSVQGKMTHGGRWRFEEVWPLPQTKFTRYYLHSDGTLKLELPAVDVSPSSYSYNPNDPVPTIGGPYAYPRYTSGPRDQLYRKGIFGCKDDLPISSRPDVLSFITPQLEEDIEVIGPVMLKFWASSSVVDTDFTAKLIDVYPPNEDYPHGYALGLIDGIIRARYRESLERSVLMEAGKVYEFTIDLWQMCNLFKAGHKLRLDISNSNFPAFDVNPNTGERVGYHTRTVVAHNTIYHDAEHLSHIVLPVISKSR